DRHQDERGQREAEVARLTRELETARAERDAMARAGQELIEQAGALGAEVERLGGREVELQRSRESLQARAEAERRPWLQQQEAELTWLRREIAVLRTTLRNLGINVEGPV